MTLARTSFAALTVLALTAFGGAKAEAASYEHIDSLASQLQRQSSSLYWEIRRHYSHAAHANHLLSDSAEMYRMAAHIHEVAHVGGSLQHIASDLDDLDRLFHHMEDLVGHTNHDAFHGGGHVHGNARHVRRLMNQMERTLHHLRSDVNEMRAPVYDPHFGHGSGIGVPYGPYGNNVYKWNGGGVTIGSGGFKIKF